jgi:spore coat protein CotF
VPTIPSNRPAAKKTAQHSKSPVKTQSSTTHSTPQSRLQSLSSARTGLSMTDKEYMQDILSSAKQLSGLYHYAVQESCTPKVLKSFRDNMNSAISLEHQIFDVCSQNGWYQTDPAEKKKVVQTKTKYQNQSKVIG